MSSKVTCHQSLIVLLCEHIEAKKNENILQMILKRIS